MKVKGTSFESLVTALAGRYKDFNGPKDVKSLEEEKKAGTRNPKEDKIDAVMKIISRWI